MVQFFKNNAVSTLGSQLSDAAVTLFVKTGDGDKFPSFSGDPSEFFLVTIYRVAGNQEADHEIVKVTSRVGDALGIVRGQEGTSPRNWSAGDFVELRVTAGTLDGFFQSAHYLDTGIGAGSVETESVRVQKHANNTGYPLVNLGYAADGTYAFLSVGLLHGGDSYRPLDVYTENRRRVRVYTGVANVFAVGGYTLLPTWGNVEVSGVGTTVVQVGRDLSLFWRSATMGMADNAYIHTSGDWYVPSIGAANPSSAIVMNGGSITLKVTPSTPDNTPITWTDAAVWSATGNLTLSGDVSLSANKKLKVNGNAVVGDRDIGWTAATGTPNKGSFDTSTATTANCAERIKALEDALRAHGLIN